MDIDHPGTNCSTEGEEPKDAAARIHDTKFRSLLQLFAAKKLRKKRLGASP
jgi:hypothetical protein